jgi:sulfide:quinone oxidoreductase
MAEEGSEFYTVEETARVRELLPAFEGGDVIIGVLGNFFKCPAAPFETAFMLHDYLEKRGLRATSTIKIVSLMGMPIPISPEASTGILEAAGERDIEWCPQSKVTALDPATKIATLEDGRTMPYTLFLGIPVHRAPQVVTDSALAEDGWIPVDHRNFATKFENVYAVGDVTSAPVPRVGAIAEGEAGTLAEVLVHQIKGGEAPAPYRGTAICYIEFGGDRVARFDANFLSGPTPTGSFMAASEEIVASKVEFGDSRHRRWFGVDWALRPTDARLPTGSEFAAPDDRPRRQGRGRMEGSRRRRSMGASQSIRTEGSRRTGHDLWCTHGSSQRIAAGASGDEVEDLLRVARGLLLGRLPAGARVHAGLHRCSGKGHTSHTGQFRVRRGHDDLPRFFDRMP